jgi:hypothetical protein
MNKARMNSMLAVGNLPIYINGFIPGYSRQHHSDERDRRMRRPNIHVSTN